MQRVKRARLEAAFRVLGRPWHVSCFGIGYERDIRDKQVMDGGNGDCAGPAASRIS